MTDARICPSIGRMTTARDELFCKFAIQNGAWTREEAILFIKHYRATGDGTRFGDWAAAQGAIDATLATRIENTIDQRLSQGSTVVRAKPAAAADTTTARKGGVVSTRLKKRTQAGNLGIDFQRKPVQSSVFLLCGVLAIGIVFAIIFQFQKSKTPAPIANKDINGASSSSEGGASSAATDKVQQMPVFSEEEIKFMNNQILITIADARSYLRDGKSAIGLKQLKKVRAELGGDELPAEQLGKIDGEIAEMTIIIEEIYTESLEELKEARASGNDQDIQDVLSEIEQMCGPDYRARAEKEGS
ncbi:MAG: hypothetical protein VYD70_04925 [Planctomycetota bacterium]|nr:hypothetical protein [Planctomycetota bacterium]